MPSHRPERETVLHNWSVQSAWNGPTIVGGQGARLFTAAGRSILDFSSQSECSNLGHQHPAVVRAIQDQAERLCYVSNAWGAEPRARLAEMLLEKSGFDGGRVFFTLGGADANEHAVKIARQALGRPRGIVIARDRSYHGATHAAMAFSGDTRVRDQVDAAAYGVVHALPPYAYRCPFGTTTPEACGARAAAHVSELIGRIGREEVAAILMEPNAGTNGIVAPDNYWPLLRETATWGGAYLIADEVMSGFGRCGEWFAWQRYGRDARPDIMTIAKGLTGAHAPLGAVVLSAEVAAKLEDQMLYSGLTFGGHPLSCAAGVAAIEAYEADGLIERSRRLGATLFASLQALQTRHPTIGDVRGGHGLFAILEFVEDRASRAPLAPWPEEPAMLKHVVREALDEGVSFALRGNLLIIAPPLVISEQEIADALTVLDRLLTRHASVPRG